MTIINREQTPRYRRDGIESFLLVAGPTCGARNLTVTLVEMEPGGFQHVHQHPNEQVYYLLEGHGTMTVGDAAAPVAPGDCVHIPPGARHGLRNTGAGVLRYLSAAAPGFTDAQCRELWPLDPIA